MMRLRLLQLLLLSFALNANVACVNVKEHGQTVFHCSANAGYISYSSPAGSKLIINNFDPATTHTAVGNMVSKGILSAGTAAATSGFIP